MLDFIRRSYKLLAPIDGKVVDLTKIPDDIFAEKMAGDGIAIEATGDTVVAPADGEITLIFKTNHAFGLLLDNKVEVLVHVGLDTVCLCGEGFHRLVEEGKKVKAGDAILRFDREYIKERNCSFITPVLITNMDNICFIELNIGEDVKAGEDVVLKYKFK
ncbi:PTS sugar transporter subunit IIA [Clostridium oryzae]|uniref:Glucose-specific phosphotransferase enzyme IIA component n=1 Tax=Clostridium oryzae TaxID=1450648 RepID=A0A1V4IN56_9CLOT|nr:PTS glucose transporter subunit IIA [Clostridium oryzae]OPJ61279.1 glucose-specific phosphotransferase enzyme IIA component [Clostridium oryzae]